MNGKITTNIFFFVLFNLLINIKFMDCSKDCSECKHACCTNTKTGDHYCCVKITFVAKLDVVRLVKFCLC
uniref:Uncharacterized protein n=1 Tax=Meloidogyne enterolobii TaxID=390850 RepID=A0A6V7VIF5_MELEN|nr:unnamed protein product [Meloidogyne enterolobii]